MTLTFVNPARSANLNVLLYSGPGTGKTSAALSAPGPIMFLNAEGPGAAIYARRMYGNDQFHEAIVEGAETLREALLTLRGEHPFKTVVLDSIGAAFQVVLEGITNGGKPTLPQYGDATTVIERFCRALRDLPVNVVLVAHEVTVKDEESGVIERLPYTGTSNPALGVKLLAQADVAGYCGRAIGENKQPRYVAQLFNGAGRRGKDRTGLLGDVRDLDLNEWVTVGVAQQTQPEEKAAV